MKADKKYLQFPLFLLNDLFIDKSKTINNIFNYGIYRYSKTIKYELNEVAQQLMYVYYRQRSDMPNDLHKIITKYIEAAEINLDEDYSGFNDKEFNPEQEIECILKLFDADENFKTKSIELYQIKMAYNYLGFKPNYKNCLKFGKEIELTILDKEVMPMVSIKLLFDFRDSNKTELELIQFAAFIAVRSIIGKKQYCFTNSKMIISRIFGYKSSKYFPKNLPLIIEQLQSKYSKRYHFEKLMQSLEMSNWNLMFYSNFMRGYYVGIRSENFNELELALEAESKKQKNKIALLKKSKSDAKKTALNIISMQIKQQLQQQIQH